MILSAEAFGFRHIYIWMCYDEDTCFRHTVCRQQPLCNGENSPHTDAVS